MAKKGEQLPLIDVAPENAKPIIEAARLHKKYLTNRLEWLAKEKAQKQKVLSLVREAHLQRVEGGVIRFTYDNAEILITPRDELVQLKEKDQAPAE